MSFPLSTASVSHEAALMYRRYLNRFGVSLKMAEAVADLSYRLANTLPEPPVSKQKSFDCGVTTRVDKVAHPWRMRFIIDKRRNELTACEFLSEELTHMVVHPHAWFRFFQRLSIANIHPTKKDAKKEMIRSLLRGVWWIESPKGEYSRTFNCVDLRFRWGPYMFKLVESNHISATGSQKKILVTCYPHKGQEDDSRRKKRDKDERPRRKRVVRGLLRQYLSGELD